MKIAVLAQDQALQVGYVEADGLSFRPLRIGAEQARSGVLALLQKNGAGPECGDPLPFDGYILRAPVPHPIRNIFCVGKNYADHARELVKHGAEHELPKYPIFFTKVPETVIGPGDPILIDPAVSTKMDYEAELAVIIGKEGRNISAAAAMEHVWGYTIVNDVTARDLQRRHQQWLIGKSQDNSCPMGPWAVTADEIDLADTSIRAYVNGELRQDGNTRDLIFGVPELIAALSNGITLKPGDIIATGTPAGVGLGFDPPRFLKDGDVVRIEIGGIGVLENPVRLR